MKPPPSKKKKFSVQECNFLGGQFIPSDMFMEYFQPLLNYSIKKSWLDHRMAHIVMSSDLTICLRVITMELEVGL